MNVFTNTRGHLTLLALAAASASFAFDFANQQPIPNGEGGAFSSPLSGQLIADDFVSAGTGTANDLTFWGSFFFQGAPYANSTVLPFDVFLYSDAGGAVGSQLGFESVSATLLNTGGITSFGNDAIYSFGASLSGLSLTGGTTYWLSIQSTSSRDFRWHNGLTGDSLYAVDNGSGWTTLSGTDRDNEAFVLSSVPEPASMVVLGLGVVGLLARRRRK